MVSPREIDDGEGRPRDSLSLSRREEEHGITRQASGIIESAMAFPVMVIFFVLQSVCQVLYQLVGDPMQMIRDFFAVNRETDEFLKDAPVQQRHQQREMHHIHEEQVGHRQKLENLRRRIKKIEDRRASREQNHGIPEMVNSPRSPTQGNTKKHM